MRTTTTRFILQIPIVVLEAHRLGGQRCKTDLMDDYHLIRIVLNEKESAMSMVLINLCK